MAAGRGGRDSSAGSGADLILPAAVMAALRTNLHEAAAATVRSVTAEVPGYSALGPREQENLAAAVELALRGLVGAASRGSDPEVLQGPALDGAYDLGRGEARAGRSMDALLRAYRVGARVSWREFATVAVGHGLAAGELARFAELVFAYIDGLSAASVAGHADEQARAGRDLARNLEQLGRDLLAGAPADRVTALAKASMWNPPAMLVAVLVPTSKVRALLPRLDLATLQVAVDIHAEHGALGDASGVTALLVPVAGAQGRADLLGHLVQQQSAVGPARAWLEARSSYQRAVRAWELQLGSPVCVDSESRLPELAVTADPEVLADLRVRATAPLSHLRPAVADRLAQTLGAWLRHQGRRNDVAAELFIHPQTVRYRMTQVRECYGELLTDPRAVMELTIALAIAPKPLSDRSG